VNSISAIGQNFVYLFELDTLTTGGQWTQATSMPVGRWGHVAVRVRQ
jgi:hypothetical protein